MARVLTPAAVEAIHTMRAELDVWGEPKYSGEAIAEKMGVSESTVWRVLKMKAAYKLSKVGNGQVAARFAAMEVDRLGAAEQVRPDLERAAEESQRKLAGLLEREAAAKALITPETVARAKAYGAFDGDEL